jgi:hypothetical protein
MSDNKPEQQEQRKASDILLSVESQMSSFAKTMGVYDLNIKLVLDRVNTIYQYIEQLKTEANQQEPDQQIIQTTTEHVMPISDRPTPDRRMGRVEAAIQIPTVQKDPVVQVPAPQARQEPTIQVPQGRKTSVPDKERKVPVIQQIKDNTGRDLFMADVSIADENREVVHKCKTNAMGKWQAYLKPGKYYVNTVKTDTTSKKKIEALQELIIPDSETTVNLPPAVIRRN